MREISRTGKAGRAPKRSAGTHPNRDAIDMGRLGKWAWARFARRASRAPRRRRPRATSCLMITLTDRAAIPGADAAALASTQSITFKEAAARYIAVHRKDLRTPSTRHNGMTIATYLGQRFWSAISTPAMCTACLSRPARRKPETARRVGGRIEKSSAGRSWPCQIKSLWLTTSGCDRSAIGGLRFASWALRKKKLTSCHAKNDREGISRHCL